MRVNNENFALVNPLRREQLADEAFADLLGKHGNPLKLKDQLRESLYEAPLKPRRPTKRARGWWSAWRLR